MALKLHNEKRKLHCADPYTVDQDMAKALQRMLDQKQAPTAALDRPALYRTCLESFYTAPAGTSDADVMNKNLATDFWYAKKSAYDFTTGVGSPPAEAEVFTRMVWKTKTGKVAFARRNGYVMAWYCPSGTAGINVGDAAAFRGAVKADTCAAGSCADNLTADRYKKCYQAGALSAHNAKRKDHKVPNLETDIDVARKAQKAAEELWRKYQAGDTTASVTLDAEDTKKCGWNSDIAASTTDAENKAWATGRWYAKGHGYNWAEKKYDAVAAPFVNMIWRSTTRVGFGVAGKAVVALYCPKGNIKGGFTCNVC